MIEIGKPEAADRAGWAILVDGYNTFYERTPAYELVERAWNAFRAATYMHASSPTGPRPRRCGRVYWSTQASNDTAWRLYDRVAVNRGFHPVPITFVGGCVVVVLLAPFALVVLAALAAFVVVGRSSLAITDAGVAIRNYPQAPVLVPLARVGRFEATPRAGNLSGVRPATAVLVLIDGSRLPVRKVNAPAAGRGVDALNARVEFLRTES